MDLQIRVGTLAVHRINGLLEANAAFCVVVSDAEQLHVCNGACDKHRSLRQLQSSQRHVIFARNGYTDHIKHLLQANVSAKMTLQH